MQVLRLSHTRVLAVRVAAAGRRLPRPGPPSSAASSPLRRDPSAPTSPTASWCTRQVRPSEPSATCASARPPVSRSFRPAGPDASRSTRTIGGNGGPSGRNATSVAAALAREGVGSASRILRRVGRLRRRPAEERLAAPGAPPRPTGSPPAASAPTSAACSCSPTPESASTARACRAAAPPAAPRAQAPGQIVANDGRDPRASPRSPASTRSARPRCLTSTSTRLLRRRVG